VKCELLVCVLSGPTFNNSVFRPHRALTCFGWISERRTIVSQYCINWLVFITEAELVYCAVPTGSLNIFQVNLLFSKGLVVYGNSMLFVQVR